MPRGRSPCGHWFRHPGHDHSSSRSTPPIDQRLERCLSSPFSASPSGRQQDRANAVRACARPCGHRARGAIQRRSQKCSLARRCRSALWLRLLLHGVLKETTHDGQPHKNCNKHNPMPRWGNEGAARWSRTEVCVCGHRASNCITRDHALSPVVLLIIRCVRRRKQSICTGAVGQLLQHLDRSTHCPGLSSGHAPCDHHRWMWRVLKKSPRPRTGLPNGHPASPTALRIRGAAAVSTFWTWKGRRKHWPRARHPSTHQGRAW